jgi:sigma-E factor negative regulatory protein RseA
MNDALKMQISAFIDGELPENESELLLRRLSQDGAMRQQVAQYLSIGRLIRREQEVPGMGELRNRIAAALGEEPVEAAPAPEPSRRRYLKPAAGVAVAASVAVAALIGLRQAELPEAPQRSVASESAPVSVADNVGYTEPAPAALAERPGEMLMQYYLSHGATSADLGANGILTRLVTLELREGELVEIEPGQERRPGDAADRMPADRDPHVDTGEQARPDSQ